MTPAEGARDALRLDLGARIDAIQAALQGVSESAPDAVHTLRAIARSTAEQAEALQMPVVREAAILLGRVPDYVMVDPARKLVAALREAAAAHRPEAGVLVVGGDADVFKQLSAALLQSIRPVLHAQTGEEARRIAKERPIACIVLNTVLPDLDGRTLAARWREHAQTAAIPILTLGGRLDESLKEDTLVNAADSYLEKPRDVEAIAAWVTSKLRRAPEVPKAARRDLVTGLLNRAAFRETCEILQQECGNAGEPMTLATLSLETARESVSDESAREEVLRVFGLLLSSSLRTTDVVARWSLYEFAVLFPGQDATGGTRAIEKILETLRSKTFDLPSGETVKLTASAGVTLLAAGDALDDAMAETAHHVYQATTLGGNQVVSQRQARTPARAARVLLLLKDAVTAQILRQMLERDNFHVTHQDQTTPEMLAGVSSHHYHLVVVDEALAAPGGIAAVRAMRADVRNSRLPIIMLVSTNSEEAVSQALESGANDYIIRPFSPFLFISRAHRLLSRRSLQRRTTENVKILIIAEDRHALVLAASALHRRGRFAITLAKGAGDALNRFDADAPDVVLLDTDMTDPAAPKLLARLAREVQSAGFSVIAADTPPLAKQTTPPLLLPFAVRGHLAKPLNPLKLGQEVETILGMKPAAKIEPPSADALNVEIRRVMQANDGSVKRP